MDYRQMQYVLALRNSLDVCDRNLSLADATYHQYTDGQIDNVEYQLKAVESACREPSGWWNAEMGTASGKTIVEALVALNFLPRGRVIYVCPSSMALGDLGQGIINKFFFVFEKLFPGKFVLGELNEDTASKDVLFFTPGHLVRLREKSPELFSMIFKDASLMILDEGHHFPEDAEDELPYFGTIREVARNWFLSMSKKVVSLTATHGRMDGKSLGEVHYKVTLADVCAAGRCPELYSASVYLDIQCPGATDNKSYYDLHLQGEEREKYLGAVVDCIMATHERRPKPLAVFVSRIVDAETVAADFNLRSGFGAAGLVMLCKDTPRNRRLEIQRDISEGRLKGYVTCAVGAESIDIKPLEVVHLVHRTKSINFLMQAVGRAMRLWLSKRSSLVVDYHVKEKKILRGCLGMMDFGQAIRPQNQPFRLRNGGPVLTQHPECYFEGLHLDTEKMLLTADDAKMKVIRAMMDKLMDLPKKRSNRKFAATFTANGDVEHVGVRR